MDETIVFFNPEFGAEDDHDSSTEDREKYFFTNPSFQLTYSNMICEAKNELLSVISEFREKLRMKEQEVHSYRENMEILEDEHNSVLLRFSEAEKLIEHLQSKCHEYELLVSHYREEIEILYQDISLRKSKISFSEEYEDKNVQAVIECQNEQIAIEDEVHSRLELHEQIEKVTYEKEELKAENTLLKRHVEKLLKDLEDLDFTNNYILKNKKIVNSTPLKPKNFMTYDALGLSNRSLSFDEDFSALGPNLFPKIVDIVDCPLKNCHRSVSDESAVSVITSIDNEEMPSYIASNRTVNNASYLSPTYFISRPESEPKNQSTLQRTSEGSFDINTMDTIENEKFPDIKIPDDSTDSVYSKVSHQTPTSPDIIDALVSPPNVPKHSKMNHSIIEKQTVTEDLLDFSPTSSVSLIQSLEEELRNCQHTDLQKDNQTKIRDPDVSLTETLSMSVCTSLHHKSSTSELSIFRIESQNVPTNSFDDINKSIVCSQQTVPAEQFIDYKPKHLPQSSFMSPILLIFHLSSLFWLHYCSKCNYICAQTLKLFSSFNYDIFHYFDHRLFYLLIFVSIFFLFQTVNSFFIQITNDTWILPHYSVQEILQDIITQICRFQ